MQAPERCQIGAKLMLTDAFIRGASEGTHWDISLKGFGIRIGKHSKTFVVLIDSGRRHSIERYPLVPLAAARKEARRILAEKQLGKVRPTHAAFDDAKRDLRTVRDYTRLLNRHLTFGR